MDHPLNNPLQKTEVAFPAAVHPDVTPVEPELQ
jgi:hypothetical protein